jgi:endonuclease V-like protein UPF0215 family
MKLSKGAKARLKMMNNAEKKAVVKAAKLLAESECISMKRAHAIVRTTESKSLWRS